jgi:REP element-mobilizing transposase RayT
MDERPGRGHRALRRGRWSEYGRIYLITAVTAAREPLFLQHEPARIACRSFLTFGTEGTSSLMAWVLMPDHAHWLLQLGNGESLPQAVNRLKSGSARRVKRGTSLQGNVWARGFHDRALRSDDNLIAAARYVVANPIRASLVERIADYPYWDSTYL